MTRINLVDVYTLSDQHLIAEYRELPRIFGHVLKAIENGKTVKDFNIPKEFKLGKGHVLFFYNKLKFLNDRYNLIIKECLNRGFNIKYRETKYNFSNEWYNDWIPSEDDIQISFNRIQEKIEKKSSFYKFYGKNIY